MSVRARPHQRPYPPRRHNGDTGTDSPVAKSPSDPARIQHKAALARLSEMFTDWKEDDLLSLLIELNGDVELAATQITEGHAEQWGNVTRKKDKKGPSTPTFQQREYSPAARGGFRGGRGGGRGGARPTRGTQRDGPTVNGHGHNRSESTPASFVDGHTTSTTTAPGTDTSLADTQQPATDSAWGESVATENGDTTTTVVAPPVTTETSADTQDHPKSAPTTTAPQHPPSAAATKQAGKLPGAPKLSWAQIARPQEKPKSAPPPIVAPAPIPAAHLPPAQPQQPQQPPPPAREPTPPVAPEQTGWEAPTTVEPPTWDDEPSVPTAAAQAETWNQTQPVIAADGWVNVAPAPAPDPKPPAAPAAAAATPAEQPKTEAPAAQPPVAETKPAEPRAPSPPPGLPTPSVVSVTPALSVAPTQPSTSSKPSTPRHSHRNAARYKTDQAVVMPGIHFGSTNTAFDKVGMQFGSLSIGSDLDAPGVTDQPTEPAPQETPAAVPAPEPTQAPQPAQQQAQPPAPQPAAPSPSANQALYQQQSPVHTQAPPSATAPALAPVAQPIQTLSHQQSQTNVAAHHPTQTQTQTHHQPQNPSLGGHSHHPSYSQHLPQHLDSSLPQHAQQQPHATNQAAHVPQQAVTSPTYAAPGSHFRQPEQNYYAGTPTSQGHQQQQQQQQQQQYIPQQSLHQGQQQQHPQQQDGPYSGAFTPLGQQPHHGAPGPQNHLGGPGAQNHLPSPLGPPGQQQGHLSGGPIPQGPGAHLSGFGTAAGAAGNAGEYGPYTGDVGRQGLYDSYGAASGYGGRMGHEDVGKPLSAGPQNQAANQGAQGQPATPNALGPQSAQAQHGQGQGQQQYPNMLPMGSVPYYYPYYNQYSGYPPGGYQPPFVKYPPMYGTGPNPGQQQSKPIPNSGGSQSPYGSALHHGAYGGPGGAGYEDPSGLYQQPGNQGANDYTKNQQQLYSGQGMQNYIGGQGAGTPQLSGGPQRGPGSTTGVVSSSPENYKPYNSGPDKSNGTTGAPGRVGGQPQQGGVGAGGGSGYYPGRFGNAPQPPNQPGYPQQPADGPYYQYQTQQPRHQGGYWQ